MYRRDHGNVMDERKLKLEGKEYICRGVSFGVATDIVLSGDHELKQLAGFALHGAFTVEGEPVWDSLDSVLADSFPLVKAVGQIVTELSRLGDTVEDLAGN